MTKISSAASDRDENEKLETIRKWLSHDPLFVAYDEIVRRRLDGVALRGSANQNTSSDMDVGASRGGRSSVLTPPTQKARIVKACFEYLKDSRNRPVTTRHLVGVLNSQDIQILGRNPGTTLDAILHNNPAFELVDRKKGNYSPT
jgi:hypothetical protein